MQKFRVLFFILIYSSSRPFTFGFLKSDVRFVFLITSLFVPLPDLSFSTNALSVTFTTWRNPYFMDNLVLPGNYFRRIQRNRYST